MLKLSTNKEEALKRLSDEKWMDCYYI